MDTTTKRPTTETEALFKDLSKPSLHALSYALRHPDTWPEGFYWNYDNCDQCAMGLAHQLWRKHVQEVYTETGASVMAKAFGMPYGKAERIFLEGPKNHRYFGIFPRGYRTMTPDMVADDIDAYLKSCE